MAARWQRNARIECSMVGICDKTYCGESTTNVPANVADGAAVVMPGTIRNAYIKTADIEIGVRDTP